MPDLAQTLARARVPLGFFAGAMVLWLAHPTAGSLAAGGALAVAGEAIRFWAAGHLEKGREVTSSGPYRHSRHPLYMGSTLIAAGVAVASARWSVGLLLAAYMTATIAAAIRHEEANMRAAFGDDYDRYRSSRATLSDRSFSFARAIKNREHRTVAGLLVIAAVFAFKAWRHL